MPKICPYCLGKREEGAVQFVRYGFFLRTSDGRSVQRFRCQSCRHTFSQATSHSWFRQKKRMKNHYVKTLLASNVSMRRTARILNLNRKTVTRKLRSLGFEAERWIQRSNQRVYREQKCSTLEFDDLETIEHTKCKPLSITLAVEHQTRRILGVEVARMPAKGLLVEKSLRKYGPRADDRAARREALFQRIQEYVDPKATIKSDENPHYVATVRSYFPEARHLRYEGKRGANTGQGELKKVKFDPLFSLNHTCAMYRANTARLIRKTWCTTKRPEHLRAHLYIYAQYHNQHLTA